MRIEDALSQYPGSGSVEVAPYLLLLLSWTHLSGLEFQQDVTEDVPRRHPCLGSASHLKTHQNHSKRNKRKKKRRKRKNKAP